MKKKKSKKHSSKASTKVSRSTQRMEKIRGGKKGQGNSSIAGGGGRDSLSPGTPPSDLNGRGMGLPEKEAKKGQKGTMVNQWGAVPPTRQPLDFYNRKWPRD